MKITREEANTIAEWLGSDDLDKLLNAKETLGELGPDAVTVLRAFAHKDAGRYRAGRRRLWCLSALTVTLCFCLLLGQVIKVWHVSDAAPFLLMSVWLTAPFFLAWYDSHRTCQKRLNHTTVLLRRMMPVSAICELIEVMELGDNDSSHVAARSLAQLLLCLKPTDRISLDAQHHVYLHRALRGYDSYLIIAILQALEIAGDHRDIAEVQRLTNCPVWVAQDLRIRTAAQRCLSILQTRADEMGSVQTFLRMASAPTLDSLLRPASHVSVEHTQQLLHASMMTERKQ